MQYQVPQGIDIEDKIVGPLTLIQFLYVLVGGIIDYLLFLTFGGNIIFWILGIPIALVALALAFLKIQDQSLSYFAKAGLSYFSRPKTRLWQRQGFNPSIIKMTVKKKVEAKPAPKRKIEKSELEKLAYALDTRGKK
ncbi:MAG: PrgI family protein [Patescibacteria group bacterium]